MCACVQQAIVEGPLLSVLNHDWWQNAHVSHCRFVVVRVGWYQWHIQEASVGNLQHQHQWASIKVKASIECGKWGFGYLMREDDDIVPDRASQCTGKPFAYKMCWFFNS